MSGPLAYLNGKFIPRGDARVAIHDAGFVFGAAVTDFCRTFRHTLYRWPQHLERFHRDCEVCFISLTSTDDELSAVARELVEHNSRLIDSREELALVTFATPGPFGFYADSPHEEGQPTLCLHTAILPFSRYRAFFTEGVALDVLGRHDTSADDLSPPSVKHRSRLHWWRAEQIVRERCQNTPGPDKRLALLTDSNGCLLETAIGNLLIVRDGCVLTPGSGVLDSISLRVVEELCARLGIPFKRCGEGMKLADCAHADEAMLCGSAFCLAGARWLAGHDIPWPGPITQRLLSAWTREVGVDIAGQFVSPP